MNENLLATAIEEFCRREVSEVVAAHRLIDNLRSKSELRMIRAAEEGRRIAREAFEAAAPILDAITTTDPYTGNSVVGIVRDPR